MQAAVVAAMAAHTILAASPLYDTLLFPFPTHNLPSVQSTFIDFPMKLPRQSLPVAVTAPNRPLAIFAATKKAVAVLKGNSKVEGVVTLTQEDGGPFLFSFFFLFSVDSFAFLIAFSVLGFWFMVQNFSFSV